PNPFNSSTTICYSLPASADIRLNIYNLKGEKVRTLINQHCSAGTFEISWNGRNDNNVRAASGIYIYRMEINTGRETVSQSHQMLLLK
ncbi:MAG: T9SS type A sorting domain-containing protein, partial [Bacteroidales bacterium]